MGRPADRPDDAASNRPRSPFPPVPERPARSRERCDRAPERCETPPGAASRHDGPGTRPPPSIVPAIGERITWALTGAGFPQLLIERGRVVLSGFVLVPESDERARIRWIGSAEVNSLPYRRTFLGVYAQTLRAAGLDVQYVDDRHEPHLICTSRGAPPGATDPPD